MSQFNNQCEFLRNFIAQLLFGMKNRAKMDQKRCPKTQNKSKFPQRDWVPVNTLGVPIGTRNFTPTFRVFYAFSSSYFFETYFYLFWTMKHFPNQLQTLRTYLNMVRD